MDNIEKIIIIGSENINKLNIAKELLKLNDNLSICPLFISDKNYSTKINENYIYYMPVDIVNLSYKNNSIFYIKTIDSISTGVTLDDYYNNNIIICNIDEFNIISEKYINNENILFIWVDSKIHNNINLTYEINEANYLMQRISNKKYMYFLDETPKFISNIINQYIKTNDNEILTNFN